jgi:Zn-dependent metalloprotease
MVFGNGDTQFYPLTSIDVIGHELTHGLIQGLPDLEYKAHSGALNESYADIVGTTFEFYI